MHPTDGQADSAPVSADDVASFLLDNPASDRADEPRDQKDAAGDNPPDDLEPDEPDNPSDDSPDDDVDPDAEKQPDPTSGRKFKVTVKGEDGADLEQEVDEKELIAGYQRRADYSRKTEELARREEQAAEVVRTRVTEEQNHFVQQAQMAHALVAQLAGLKSPQEMLMLSQQDPAGYVAEQARQQQVQSVMASLQNQWQQTQKQQQQAQQAELQKSYARCWGVLGQNGIDKPKLQNIFDSFSKEYGIPYDRFAGVNDPALVLAMNDAVAYRALQKKRTEVTKKAEAAPRLPQKQAVPRNESVDKRRVERLRSGRGSRNDLAAFIAQNNL